MSGSHLIEPLLFSRICLEKVWGGQSLAGQLRETLPFAGPLGETWEVSDYPGRETTVRQGAFSGRTLRELMEQYDEDLLGRSRPTAEGRFPLLIKYIDAGDLLSVQVHPPDGRKSPTGVGKTESWYVLHAEEDAALIVGLAEGTTSAEFERVAADSRVQDHLHRLSVQAGDSVFIPHGMVHAICGGVVLCEIQQTSDVTYRLYDWDRLGLDGKPRETHVAEALGVIDYSHGPGVAKRPQFAPCDDGLARAPLESCDYFTTGLLKADGTVTVPTENLARTWAVLRGSGHLSWGGGARIAVDSYDVALIPGGAESMTIEPGAGGIELLEGVAL